MENLFISPNPDNHALAWQVLKNQPRPLLENALQEWFEWAVKELAKFQKELYSAYRKLISIYAKMERSFSKKLQLEGYDWQGNMTNGVTFSTPRNSDSWIVGVLQKVIDEVNLCVKKYHAIKDSSQFKKHSFGFKAGYQDAFSEVYEAKLLCGEITIAYQFQCLQNDNNSFCPYPSTNNFKPIFSKSSEHFSSLGNGIKSIFIRHDYKRNIKVYYSQDEYSVNMTGKVLTHKKAKTHLPQLF